jgi:hypothetical protein
MGKHTQIVMVGHGMDGALYTVYNFKFIFLLCYVMLCYVMLCYVMLCYVMLCYVMLCYVMLCYVNFLVVALERKKGVPR